MDFPKILYDATTSDPESKDPDDDEWPFIGYKTHEELSEIGDRYIAFRCPDYVIQSDCAAVPYRQVYKNKTNKSEYLYWFYLWFREVEDYLSDAQANWDGTDTYVIESGPTTGRQHAVSVRVQEDRVLGIEKKFFCDRTTEKTVHLYVRQ